MLINKKFKDNADPAYIGPGTWHTLQTMAFHARSKKDQLGFIKQMKLICNYFPCEKCRGHCKEYIKNHPLEEYLGATIEQPNIGADMALGMFIWVWKFHNSVNNRIGKNIMSWEQAFQLYANTNEQKSDCSKCSGKEEKQHKMKKRIQ